ncbi:hypothetical protein C1H46_022810 [Malus baccata]|uniref:Aminotransferase class I/classII domain-containing protein n=1 Tax=Malus baccata TaxID=106549 RepID=A0A540LYQ5_MALBA|nr:hypothetical protein C1H46_022810 [Malus baccata]
MVAKPSSYLNKSVKVDDSNIREVIHKATGLCINSGAWSGIPGYCRFTIALEESEFECALWIALLNLRMQPRTEVYNISQILILILAFNCWRLELLW